MDVEDMVDAALTGLDRGETVTIPSLPDIGRRAQEILSRGERGHAQADGADQVFQRAAHRRIVVDDEDDGVGPGHDVSATGSEN